MALLDDWTEEQKIDFRKKTVLFSHKLAQLDLFSDEALIELLDKHPRDLLDVNTMGATDHPRYPNRHLTGDCRNTEGKHLLAAAKAGRIFISLRYAMLIYPEYKKILDQMYLELGSFTGLKPRGLTGTILISSPISQTPYHFDKKEVILWHLRGKKRMYVYPRSEKFLPAQEFESVVSSYNDDLPYDASFDVDAEVIDLEPGMAASWPLNAPHRVDNQSFCVSINTEFATFESITKISNMVTNAALRKKLGLDPSYERNSKVTRLMKLVAGQAISRTTRKKESVEDLVTFRVDPDSPDYITEIEPFQRNF